VLRTVLIVVLALITVATASAQDAPADSAGAGPAPWDVRNIYRWFTAPDPSFSALASDVAQPAVNPFLPFVGRPIRQVQIRARKAFGTVVPDSTDGPGWLVGAARLTASPVEAMLNDLYTGTREGVIGGYLLFGAGDLLDPFALADSERLLREAAFSNDARIAVIPADAETSQVDVVVLVRDRWPYGADFKVHDTDWFDTSVFHRNILGLGLDFEAKIRYRDDRTPNPGVALQLRAPNLGGSFVDALVQVQDAWDRDERRVSAVREFRYPGVHVVGGGDAADVIDRTLTEELGVELRWRESKLWLGHAWVMSHDRLGGRPRLRLVPAASVADLRYRGRPDSPAGEPTRFPDVTQVLGAVTLIGWESYRTRLVRGFGETEDIPAGLWMSIVGGWEHSEVVDRPYHGVSVLVPSFSAQGSYLMGRLAYGGYRHGGRLEDGLVQVQLGGFSALKTWLDLPWRHSFALGYTRGLHRRFSGGLGLDLEESVRGFAAPDARGDERLRGGVETLAFLPPSILGFKFAGFAFADAGLLGPGDEPLFAEPLYVSLGGGVRIKNPGLVFPTLQIRLARIRDDDGWHTELAVQSNGDSFFDFLRPGAEPAVLPYR